MTCADGTLSIVDHSTLESAVRALLTSFEDVKSNYPDNPALRALAPAVSEFTRVIKWTPTSSSSSSSTLLLSSSSSGMVDDSIDEDETPNDEDMKKLYRLSQRVVSNANAGNNSNNSNSNSATPDVKRGWLLKRKRKDTVAMQQLSQWRRRFFVLNANFLYYFAKENDDSPLGFVDVTTTRVRASDAPGKNKLFCFDMISVASTWQIQSPDSETDTRAWQAVIEAAAQKSLLATLRRNGSDGSKVAASASTGVTRKTSSSGAWRTELPAMLALSQNGVCADCGAAKPTWASINLGVFICLECAGVHRSLGTHISKVRSTDLDEWDGIDLAVMDNAKANLFFESTLSSATVKPNARSPVADRDKFIRAKYVAREFLPTPPSAAAATTGSTVSLERSGSAPPPVDESSMLSPRSAAAAAPLTSTLSRNRRAAVVDGVVVHNNDDAGESDLDRHRQLLLGVIETVQLALNRLKLSIATDERVEATLMGRGRAVREMQQHASMLYTSWGVARGPTPPLADDMDRLHRLQVMLAYSIGDLENLFDAGLVHVQRASSQSKLLSVLQPVHSIKRTLQKIDDPQMQ